MVPALRHARHENTGAGLGDRATVDQPDGSARRLRLAHDADRLARARGERPAAVHTVTVGLHLDAEGVHRSAALGRGRQRVLHMAGVDRHVGKLIPVEAPIRPNEANANRAPTVDAHPVGVKEDHVTRSLGLCRSRPGPQAKRGEESAGDTPGIARTVREAGSAGRSPSCRYIGAVPLHSGAARVDGTGAWIVTAV